MTIEEADYEFTPENIREAANRVRELREHLLFGINDTGADPEAEQFYLLALSSLEEACRFLKLSALKQSAALAARSR